MRYTIISAENRDSFTSFSICMPLIDFSCQSELANIMWMMLNRSGDNGHPVSILPWFRASGKCSEGFPLGRTLALAQWILLALSQHWVSLSALTDSPRGSGKYYFFPYPFEPKGSKGFPLWPISGDTPNPGRLSHLALASISFPFISAGFCLWPWWLQGLTMSLEQWEVHYSQPYFNRTLVCGEEMSTEGKAAFPGASWNISLLVPLSSSWPFKKKALPIC